MSDADPPVPLVLRRRDSFPAARTQYPLSQFAARFLVDGIHMAGPDLDADTFARGLFRIPPTGGGPTTPQVSYGNWGLFADPDYSGIDDAVRDLVGPDRRGRRRVRQPGLGRVAPGARRCERSSNEDDAPDPDPFGDPARTVTVFDELPDEDTPPDYPPPPGSPAEEER